MTMLTFARQANVRLAAASAREFADVFIDMRMTWFSLYAKGRVSSTRHGAEFFTVVEHALTVGEYFPAESEYDVNFATILYENFAGRTGTSSDTNRKVSHNEPSQKPSTRR
jgi:hypothetical protein